MQQNNGRLAGKVAIITGGSQGMGKEHAVLFANQGAKVVIADIDSTRGEALATELGENAMFVRLDVSKETDWHDAVSKAEGRFGPVTVLVNNAGIIGPIAKAAELNQQDYEKVCAINQTGVYLGMKAAIPSMLKAGGGSIVNISSISGIVAIFGTPNLAYAGSKFAVRGMTKQVAIEYAAQGIRANSVHPGYIKTAMATEALDEESMKAAEAGVPIKRMAEPAEVSNLVLFLASDESSFVTGAEHIIDGGLTAL